MKQIILNKTKDYQIGNVRVSKEAGKEIEKRAKHHGVSNQTIVRAIVENFIFEAEFN